MTVPSPISSSGADPGRPSADPTLAGWYLDKPATLRVSDPFLVVQADNAEVVFPRREFRFEVIGPSPTRPGTQQLMFIGDAVNVVFETPFDGGWERFIESVPPELVVTPEAAQLEAAGLRTPPAVGLRIGELDIEPASPPPPQGPMLSRPDGSSVTVEIASDTPPIPVARITADAAPIDEPSARAGDEPGESLVAEKPSISDVPRIVLPTEAASDATVESDMAVESDAGFELAEPELFDFDSVESDFVEADLIESMARRDLELADLDMEVEADLENEAALGGPGVVDVLDERDPAELDGLLDLDSAETDPHEHGALGASGERGSRLFGDAANRHWHDDVAPTVYSMAGVVLPVLRVVAPVFIISRAIVRLRDGMTVLDRLLDLVLAVGVATLTAVAMGALLALIRPADRDGFSLLATLDERLTRSARRVGLSACFVAGLVALMAMLSPSLDRDITSTQAGWTIVATAAAFAVSAACSARANEVRARDSLDDMTMEEAR